MIGGRRGTDLWPGEEPAGQRWAAEVADQLGELGHRLRRLVEQVSADWTDAAGREWADRADEARRELDAQARQAAEIGRAGDPHLPSVGGTSPDVAAWGRPGIRLAGTAGSRASDERGVRIPELPPG